VHRADIEHCRLEEKVRLILVGWIQLAAPSNAARMARHDRRHDAKH
jgi:hypothetical protein